MGVARLHYADKRAGIDHWETLALVQRVDDAKLAEPWDGSEPFDGDLPELDKVPETGVRFAPLATELTRVKNYAQWTKTLKSFLYREHTLRVWSCPALKAWSRPDETEREFRLRLVQASRENRDRVVEALRAKYAPKQAMIREQVRRASERLEREQVQASRSTWDATIAMGSSVLGAILGRKTVSKTNVTRATAAAKAASRAAQQRGDASQAAGSLESLQQKYDELQTDFQKEVESLDAALRPETLVLESSQLRPRKIDIVVERVVLAWMPHLAQADGRMDPLY
jgi:hypothetical protein